MTEFTKKITDTFYKKIDFKPRLKVDIDEKIKFVFGLIGWIIIIGCVYYWVHFFIIFRQYEPLVYTTYLSLVLIGLTCIFRFESVLLNSISCITFYGFINIAVFMISQVVDIFSLIVGPILHLAIGLFQLFIILHQKIPISKRYLLWSFVFFLIFMSSYDSFQRWDVITGLYDVVPTSFTEVYSFYMLIFSILGIYLYKRKYSILVK
ncbi:MAG: hypothetical protein EU552_01040 [Promethearchaeota archaeon]|nr:MAG: hypothetical protein EU552_01040 [Candidatus Lokiarchaeota archaeon]